MEHFVMISATALLLLSACQNAEPKDAPAEAAQTEAIQKTDISACIRATLELDEGKWAYMGTIAMLNGKFRTYETTSVHAAAGPDIWSYQSSGGNVSEEESQEITYMKLVGSALVPLDGETLDTETAVNYLSCTGPDEEGRYEVIKHYIIPQDKHAQVIAKNMSWYSEHGSYYAEDIIGDENRVIARRSGVYFSVAPE